MSEILWVNPVATDAFDAETREAIERVRSPHRRVRLAHLDEGPRCIERPLDARASFAPMRALMEQAEADGCAAGVIGCFFDDGASELRSLLSMPVVGMGEASMRHAATIGRFSVLVGERSWSGPIRDRTAVLGLERQLASIRPLDMGIPAMQADPARFRERAFEEAWRAVEQDGADAVVLAEIVPPELAARAARSLPVPLVDPGAATWATAELRAILHVDRRSATTAAGARR